MSDEQARLDEVCARFNAAGFYQLLGLEARSQASATSEVHLPFSHKLTQLYGGVHGGALAALCDAAVSVAVATTLKPGEAIATVTLSISFLAPAGRDGVTAIGKVTRRGKKLCFGACSILAGDREVARAEGTVYLGKEAVIDSQKQP